MGDTIFVFECNKDERAKLIIGTLRFVDRPRPTPIMLACERMYATINMTIGEEKERTTALYAHTIPSDDFVSLYPEFYQNIHRIKKPASLHVAKCMHVYNQLIIKHDVTSHITSGNIAHALHDIVEQGDYSAFPVMTEVLVGTLAVFFSSVYENSFDIVRNVHAKSDLYPVHPRLLRRNASNFFHASSNITFDQQFSHIGLTPLDIECVLFDTSFVDNWRVVNDAKSKLGFRENTLRDFRMNVMSPTQDSLPETMPDFVRRSMELNVRDLLVHLVRRPDGYTSTQQLYGALLCITNNIVVSVYEPLIRRFLLAFTAAVSAANSTIGELFCLDFVGNLRTAASIWEKAGYISNDAWRKGAGIVIGHLDEIHKSKKKNKLSEAIFQFAWGTGKCPDFKDSVSDFVELCRALFISTKDCDRFKAVSPSEKTTRWHRDDDSVLDLLNPDFYLFYMARIVHSQLIIIDKVIPVVIYFAYGELYHRLFMSDFVYARHVTEYCEFRINSERAPRITYGAPVMTVSHRIDVVKSIAEHITQDNACARANRQRIEWLISIISGRFFSRDRMFDVCDQDNILVMANRTHARVSDQILSFCCDSPSTRNGILVLKEGKVCIIFPVFFESDRPHVFDYVITHQGGATTSGTITFRLYAEIIHTTNGSTGVFNITISSSESGLLMSSIDTNSSVRTSYTPFFYDGISKKPSAVSAPTKSLTKPVARSKKDTSPTSSLDSFDDLFLLADDDIPPPFSRADSTPEYIATGSNGDLPIISSDPSSSRDNDPSTALSIDILHLNVENSVVDLHKMFYPISKDTTESWISDSQAVSIISTAPEDIAPNNLSDTADDTDAQKSAYARLLDFIDDLYT